MQHNKPQTLRQKRVATSIKRALANIFMHNDNLGMLLGEWICRVIVSDVIVSSDLRCVTCFVFLASDMTTNIETETETETKMETEAYFKILEKNKNKVRFFLSKQIKMKFMPNISFKEDTTIKDMEHIDYLLHVNSMNKNPSI